MSIRRAVTPRARQMFEDLERQLDIEAARQRAIRAIVMIDTGKGAPPTQQREPQWQATQSELLTGISSILDAFLRRENSRKASGES